MALARLSQHRVSTAILLAIIVTKAALYLFGSRDDDGPLLQPVSHGQRHARTGGRSDPPNISTSAEQHDTAPFNETPILDED